MYEDIVVEDQDVLYTIENKCWYCGKLVAKATIFCDIEHRIKFIEERMGIKQELEPMHEEELN